MPIIKICDLLANHSGKILLAFQFPFKATDGAEKLDSRYRLTANEPRYTFGRN